MVAPPAEGQNYLGTLTHSCETKARGEQSLFLTGTWRTSQVAYLYPSKHIPLEKQNHNVLILGALRVLGGSVYQILSHRGAG